MGKSKVVSIPSPSDVDVDADHNNMLYNRKNKHTKEEEKQRSSSTIEINNRKNSQIVSRIKEVAEDDGNESSSRNVVVTPKKRSNTIKSDTMDHRSSSSTSTLSSNSNSRILESRSTNTMMETKHPPYFYYQNSTNTQRHFSLHSHPNQHRNHHQQQHESTLYTNYGTTITLIAFLHILYFYQWNTRRSRSDVCTSYDQLVERKQFYKMVVAVASHPPVDGGERDVNNRGGMMMEGGDGASGSVGSSSGDNGNGNGGSASRTNFLGRFIINCNIFNRIPPLITTPLFERIHPIYTRIQQRFLHPLLHGHLSGLPLLTYCTHILWQCRALEELYDEYNGELILGIDDDGVNVTQFTGIGTGAIQLHTDDAHNNHIMHDNHMIDKHMHPDSEDEEEELGYAYYRVLIALAFTSILLELTLLRSVLRRLDGVVTFEGFGSSSSNTSVTSPRQLLSTRAVCSIASLCTALLGVYDSHFPYAPPPVLPFVRASFLNSSGFSLIFSISILAVLSYRIHPVTSVMSGLLSGSLWSLGVTSFLGTEYWGNVMLFSLAFGMVLSLKAQPVYSTYLEMLLPCIDYVSWSSQGEICDGSAPSNISNHRPNNASRGGRLSRNNSRHDDLEMGNSSHRFQMQNGGQYASGENLSYPLLSSSQSSSTSGGNNGTTTAIRGRVPRMNAMESDLDNGVDDNELVDRRNAASVMPTASSPRFGASLSRRAGGSGI